MPSMRTHEIGEAYLRSAVAAGRGFEDIAAECDCDRATIRQRAKALGLKQKRMGGLAPRSPFMAARAKERARAMIKARDETLLRALREDTPLVYRAINRVAAPTYADLPREMLVHYRTPASYPAHWPETKAWSRLRDEIIEENHRLYGVYCARYFCLAPERQWATAAAYLTAVDLYNPETGAFSTYLNRWIRKGAQDAHRADTPPKDSISTLDLWRSTI